MPEVRVTALDADHPQSALVKTHWIPQAKTASKHEP
jgi:hypothetical protein